MRLRFILNNIQKGVLHNIFHKIPKYLSAVDYALALPSTILSTIELIMGQ
jgi:hypothetical protein